MQIFKQCYLENRIMSNLIKMENSLIEEAISIVLRYLKKVELKNAALVCRSWRLLVRYEEKLRGPMVATKIRNETNTNFMLKMNILKSFKFRTDLNVFFCNNGKYKSEKCHCGKLSENAYSINIYENSKSFKIQEQDIVTSFAIPRTNETKISTYTFVRDQITGRFFCEGINFRHDINDKSSQFLKTYYDSCSSFLIFFTSFPDETRLLEFLQILNTWYCKKYIAIWAVIVDKTIVCQNNLINHFCKTLPFFTLVSLSNSSMIVKCKHLNKTCISEEKIRQEFKDFRNDVTLKRYSLALMCTPHLRVEDFYMLEDSLFKEIFPNVNLFHIFGRSCFSGFRTSQLHEFFMDVGLDRGEITSLVLITYN